MTLVAGKCPFYRTVCTLFTAKKSATRKKKKKSVTKLKRSSPSESVMVFVPFKPLNVYTIQRVCGGGLPTLRGAAAKCSGKSAGITPALRVMIAFMARRWPRCGALILQSFGGSMSGDNCSAMSKMATGICRRLLAQIRYGRGINTLSHAERDRHSRGISTDGTCDFSCWEEHFNESVSRNFCFLGVKTTIRINLRAAFQVIIIKT